MVAIRASEDFGYMGVLANSHPTHYNAQIMWDDEDQDWQLRAMRPLLAGEEILIKCDPERYFDRRCYRLATHPVRHLFRYFPPTVGDHEVNMVMAGLLDSTDEDGDESEEYQPPRRRRRIEEKEEKEEPQLPALERAPEPVPEAPPAPPAREVIDLTVDSETETDSEEEPPLPIAREVIDLTISSEDDGWSDVPYDEWTDSFVSDYDDYSDVGDEGDDSWMVARPPPAY
jgi:hypothetical protein